MAALDLTRTAIDTASSGNNTLIAAATGRRLVIHRVFLVPASSVTVKFRDGASTDLTGAMTLAALFRLDVEDNPWFTTSVGNAFVMNLGGAVQVSGAVYHTLA